MAYKSKFTANCLRNKNMDQITQINPDDLQRIVNNKDYLVPFDATSLYPSAMAMNGCRYPVIKTGVVYDATVHDIKTLNCFFLEVDIFIPHDLKFVPISTKQADGLSLFQTGLIKNMVINHCDYEELLRFGITIERVHSGIVYSGWTESPYKQFVNTLFTERAKVKDTDSVLGDFYKLLMNSSYGKTCQKMIESVMRFTTQ